MRLPYLLVPILAGVVAGCREEVTAPDTPEPPTAVPVQQRGAPAQSGVVVRFTNAEFGVTATHQGGQPATGIGGGMVEVIDDQPDGG